MGRTLQLLAGVAEQALEPLLGPLPLAPLCRDLALHLRHHLLHHPEHRLLCVLSLLLLCKNRALQLGHLLHSLPQHPLLHRLPTADLLLEALVELGDVDLQIPPQIRLVVHPEATVRLHLFPDAARLRLERLQHPRFRLPARLLLGREAGLQGLVHPRDLLLLVLGEPLAAGALLVEVRLEREELPLQHRELLARGVLGRAHLLVQLPHLPLQVLEARVPILVEPRMEHAQLVREPGDPLAVIRPLLGAIRVGHVGQAPAAALRRAAQSPPRAVGRLLRTCA
mmetsp:Transcript_79210/g.206625  ORF Transcript_79210/g.206625 Transcript_79210/m.206625 type:complete len:282 (-) Transcript_79210:3-848(-)